MTDGMNATSRAALHVRRWPWQRVLTAHGMGESVSGSGSVPLGWCCRSTAATTGMTHGTSSPPVEQAVVVSL